ncbi:uncharacterized protein LOC110700837 [Chenopodium quinoa]|nr:uncharacterized protein LOC110700837 [Chenopodium quinoa]
MRETEIQLQMLNWCHLADDDELLLQIVDRIDCHLNLCKFRAVCRSWRSPALATSRFLFSVLPLQIPVHDHHFRSLLGCENRLKFLVGSVVYLIQPLNQKNFDSPKFWVLCLEELNPGLLKFRYPLTKIPIENLPKNFPKSLNSLRFRVSIVGKGFKFCLSNGNEDVFESRFFYQGFQNWSDFPTKTKVLLFDDDIFVENYDYSFVVLILNLGGILGVMRLGVWHYMRNIHGVFFDDIVKFKGKVCAMDRNGVVCVIDDRVSRVMRVITRPVCVGDANGRRKLLAESHGKLYMIARDCFRFRVFKLNERQQKWDEVNSLEDRILIVTFDGCYFVEAKDNPGCRGNCIFFPKNCFPNYSNGYHPDDELFKGASKYLEVGVFYLNEDRAPLVSFYLGLSDMFWPPPSWIWPNSCSFTWEFEKNEQQEDCPNQKEVLGENCDDLIPRRDWSELPKELLKVLADHLATRLDHCRFRSVCKKWHSSCHLSGSLLYSQLPHHVNPSFIFEKSNRSIFLVARLTYVLRPLNQTIPNSAKPWLISVEDLNPGKLLICHPLSKIPYKDMPVNFPKYLNLLEFQVSKVSFGFKFCISNGDDKVFRDCGISIPWSDYSHPTKVVILSENATSIEDCIAVVLFLHLGGSFASINLRTNQWRYISKTKRHCFDDIVKFKGYICAVDREGIAYLIDGHNMRIVDTISEELSYPYASKQRRKLLVESFGELYLIVRGPWDFRVYKLHEGHRTWYKVNNIGDRILFVSFDSCFFVQAKDFPGCRGNCVVFPKNCFPLYSGGYDPDYELFKGERNHLTIGVFYLDENRCKLLSSYPSLSELFWPPPSWFCPDTYSW